MTHQESIDYFFSYAVEKTYNDAILSDKNYVIPYGELEYYIDSLLSVPYAEFLAYIQEHLSELVISSKNITQCSSFSACEIEMCQALLSEENPGLVYTDIGRLFPDYVTSDNETSFRKYGENQIKTAAQLGLVFEYYDYWYLSCFGYIYPNLPEEKRKSLLARTLLRDPLYARLTIDLTKGDVNLLSYMGSLTSKQTKLRRYGNVEMMEKICLDECKKEHIQIGAIIEARASISEPSTPDIKIIPKKTVMLHRPTDQSLFKYGFTIPTAMHPLWKQYFQIPTCIWVGSKHINIIVDNKQYKASLSCATNSQNKQIMQVRYTEDSPVAQYLRETLHVSCEYVMHERGPVPADKHESITVFAGNRNDTIFVKTESVAARELKEETSVGHQGAKDAYYYMGCFRDISISGENSKVIISKLCMLLSLIDYLMWLKSFSEELTPSLPILGVWEGMFINIFKQYYNVKRTSTLFSSPFILLNVEPFWEIIFAEESTSTVDGERAMMTFVNIQNTFDGVKIDQELFDLLLSPSESAKLAEYLRKLLKKYAK